MAHPILDFEMDKDTTTVKDRVVKLRGIYTWGAGPSRALQLAVCPTFTFLFLLRFVFGLSTFIVLNSSLTRKGERSGGRHAKKVAKYRY